MRANSSRLLLATAAVNAAFHGRSSIATQAVYLGAKRRRVEAAPEGRMTTFADARPVVARFPAARPGPDGNAADSMDEAFTFESPMMRFTDRAAYLDSHRAFQRLVKCMTMISELYGAEEATLLYDLETATPVGVQRTAEHFRVVDGKVSSILLLFDSAPWRPIFERLEGH